MGEMKVKWVRERLLSDEKLSVNDGLVSQTAVVTLADYDALMREAVRFAEAMKDRRWDQPTWDSIKAFLTSPGVVEWRTRQGNQLSQ